MGRVDTAFSLLAGNQKLYGWLVGTPDLLQWAAWCALHHNQATAFMSWALYILVKTMLQCLPWIKELPGVAATVGLMIAGSSSRLHSLKVLSAKEEQKVSLRKSCLAAAERREASERDFFSPTSLGARNKATVGNTFVFWIFPKVSQNSDSATRPPGIFFEMKNFLQTGHKHFCGLWL